MGRPAGFHPDPAGWKRFKEGEQLRAFDGLIEDHAAVLRNPVNLKYVLGQIQADGLYCHWVAPFPAVNDNCTLAHSMPVEQEPPTSSGRGRGCNCPRPSQT